MRMLSTRLFQNPTTRELTLSRAAQTHAYQYRGFTLLHVEHRHIWDIYTEGKFVTREYVLVRAIRFVNRCLDN